MNKSELIALLNQYDLHPSRALGQNFLIDKNFLNFITGSSNPSKKELILEIGSGPGILTEQLIPLSGAVVSVELDIRLFNIAKTYLPNAPNLTLLQTSILGKHGCIDPTVLQIITDTLAQNNLKRMKVISNLPYSIAGHTIVGLLEADLPLKELYVLVQWEVALRLIAKPSTPEYGHLSVLAQALADVQIIRKVPPEVFWPRPEVHSALICLKKRSLRGLQKSKTYEGFKALIKSVFTYKRKTVLNGLKRSGHDDQFLKKAEEILIANGLTVTARPQDLEWTVYKQLAEES
ncbi:MAG: ribosomal RNA small subunit methyltransferase A [Planctomycetes bacterium]|nr:ribosomal RNA small subunit methyltransferase A [Planctomycetota bacterium]